MIRTEHAQPVGQQLLRSHGRPCHVSPHPLQGNEVVARRQCSGMVGAQHTLFVAQQFLEHGGRTDEIARVAPPYRKIVAGDQDQRMARTQRTQFVGQQFSERRDRSSGIPAGQAMMMITDARGTRQVGTSGWLQVGCRILASGFSTSAGIFESLGVTPTEAGRC